MKLGNFPLVEALVSTRNHLIEQRDEGRLAIEINGRRVDAEFVEQMRPHIVAALNARIKATEQELRRLGVDPD